MRWSDGSLRLLMLIMWIALVRCARDLREIYGVGSGRLILSRSLILVGSGWKLAEAIKYLRFWCHFTGILNTILWDVLDTKIFHSILSGTYRKIHLELIAFCSPHDPLTQVNCMALSFCLSKALRESPTKAETNEPWQIRHAKQKVDKMSRDVGKFCRRQLLYGHRQMVRLIAYWQECSKQSNCCERPLKI